MRIFNFKYREDLSNKIGNIILMTISFDENEIKITWISDEDLKEFCYECDLEYHFMKEYLKGIVRDLSDINTVEVLLNYTYAFANNLYWEEVKTKKILINANYGWDGGNRSAVIDVPENEMEKVEVYVYNWVMKDISYNWEDITKEE